MTVIAWDGKTLAADKMICTSAKRIGTKIYSINGELFGMSGALHIGMARLAWVRAGMIAADYPIGGDSEWGQVLRITKERKIVLYNANGFPMHFEDPFHATGSGSDFALAAMYLGKSAVEAVEVACALSNECGMGIDTLEF